VSNGRDTCQGAKKDKSRCTRSVPLGQQFCWQHAHGCLARLRALSRNQLVAFSITVLGLCSPLILGMVQFFKPNPTHSLTVYVHGPRGPQDLVLRTGYVIMDIGADRRRAAISNNGNATFQEIPDTFWGKEVPLELEADGYELADPKAKARLSTTSIYLPVRKKSGHIAGQVQDETGKALADASIHLASLTTSTDISGHFDLVVPGEIVYDDLTLRVEASGYAVWTDAVTSNANDVTITLRRLH